MTVVLLLTQYQAHHGLNFEIDAIFAKEDLKQLNLPPTTPMETLLMPFLKNLLTLDYERGVAVMRSWRYWLQNVDRMAVEDFNTITDYLNYRVFNIGLE